MKAARAPEEMLPEISGKGVDVVRRFDGALMVRTHFRFPDGDSYPIHLSSLGSGRLRLSDRGHTLMHASFEHDVDLVMTEPRQSRLEDIMTETGLEWDGGALCLDTSPDGLPEAVDSFGRALGRVFDLATTSPPPSEP